MAAATADPEAATTMRAPRASQTTTGADPAQDRGERAATTGMTAPLETTPAGRAVPPPEATTSRTQTRARGAARATRAGPAPATTRRTTARAAVAGAARAARAPGTMTTIS